LASTEAGFVSLFGRTEARFVDFIRMVLLAFQVEFGVIEALSKAGEEQGVLQGRNPSSLLLPRFDLGHLYLSVNSRVGH
jgi:hypothetical protein